MLLPVWRSAPQLLPYFISVGNPSQLVLFFWQYCCFNCVYLYYLDYYCCPCRVLADLQPEWRESSPCRTHDAQFDLCLASAMNWQGDWSGISLSCRPTVKWLSSWPVCLCGCVSVCLKRAKTEWLQQCFWRLLSPPHQRPHVDFKGRFCSTSGFSINAAGTTLASVWDCCGCWCVLMSVCFFLCLQSRNVEKWCCRRWNNEEHRPSCPTPALMKDVHSCIRMKLIGATCQRTPGDGALQCHGLVIISLIGGSFQLLPS